MTMYRLSQKHPEIGSASLEKVKFHSREAMENE